MTFKYGRMQKKISSWLVHACVAPMAHACLDCMLHGVLVTAVLGYFLCSSHLYDNEVCDSLLYHFGWNLIE